MNIADYKGIHRGKRCFIIGSGPSLAAMDLSALRNEITFSCNRGHLLFGKLGFPTTYWALEDVLDAAQWHDGFVSMRGPVKFVADDLRFDGEHVPVPFTRVEEVDPPFNVEPPFQFGGTVTYLMLQLAAYMGCSVAYLLGNDFNYPPHDGQKMFTSDGNESWHFTGEYWPKGSLSFAPQPERMKRAFHAAAKSQAIRVVNLTPMSRLDVFERDEYAAVLDRDTPAIYMQQHQEELAVLAQALHVIRPHHVMEIGVLNGGSCARWHQLCTGTVFGIDRDDNFAASNRFPRYRRVRGDSHGAETLTRVRAELDGSLLDFLFIDGDHSFAGVSRDYADYRQFVRPGGLIAFHDINADAGFFETWEEGGVPRFWKMLDAPGKATISVGADWGGIGVVQA